MLRVAMEKYRGYFIRKLHLNTWTLLEVIWVGVVVMPVSSVVSTLVSALASSLVLLIKTGTLILYLTGPGPPSSLP